MKCGRLCVGVSVPSTHNTAEKRDNGAHHQKSLGQTAKFKTRGR